MEEKEDHPLGRQRIEKGAADKAEHYSERNQRQPADINVKGFKQLRIYRKLRTRARESGVDQATSRKKVRLQTIQRQKINRYIDEIIVPYY